MLQRLWLEFSRAAVLESLPMSLLFSRSKALIVLFLLLFFGFAGANPAAAGDAPNLITIVTDDQARWAMGLYGNQEIRTPNMDRIGREGINFTNAFVATPVCSPSRATYLTGLWPSQHAIREVILVPDEAAGVGLRSPTWAEVLQQNGYRTALIGKWHLGGGPKFHPTRHGFHEFVGFTSGASQPRDPELEINGEIVRSEGFLTEILTDHAIAFIKANRNRPFALSLHYRAPHLPYGPVPNENAVYYQGLDPTIPDLPGLDREQVKQWTREYYASISSVDRNIGRLLNVVDELELSHNTIVLFTSDNGYNLGFHYLSTKGNGSWIAGGATGPIRPNMFDTSIRVPLVIRWPAVIKPGSESEELISQIDIFRTILGALQIELPEEAEPEGVDFSPLFWGKQVSIREVLFGQYDMHQAALSNMRMIRTRRYKLVRHLGTHYLDEFYDLESDPNELNNLIRNPEYLDRILEMNDQLTRWRERIGDNLADRNPLWFLDRSKGRGADH